MWSRAIQTLHFEPPSDGRNGTPVRAFRLAYGPGLAAEEQRALQRGTAAGGPLPPNLIEFTPTMTAAAQVSSLTVRGWDPRTKQSISVAATVDDLPSGRGDGLTGPAAATEALGGREDTVVDAPVASVEEARQLAAALLRERAYQFITGTGRLAGLPELRLRDVLEIHGIGLRFSGNYYVTRVEHTLSASGFFTGFRARRIADGSQAMTSTLPRSRSTDRRYYGVVEALVAKVTDDPEGECRVTLRFPFFDGATAESDWCRVVQPYAGNGYGAVFVPEVGDEVLVAFVHGDMRFPIVLGGLYNGVDKPPTDRTASKDQKMIRTKHGHQAVLDDSQGKRPSGSRRRAATS